jgi:hypothetical protein
MGEGIKSEIGQLRFFSDGAKPMGHILIKTNVAMS